MCPAEAHVNKKKKRIAIECKPNQSTELYHEGLCLHGALLSFPFVPSSHQKRMEFLVKDLRLAEFILSEGRDHSGNLNFRLSVCACGMQV